MISAPNLLLQKLTTRQPDDDQIEVAVAAMNAALSADRGEPVPEWKPLTLHNPSSPDVGPNS